MKRFAIVIALVMTAALALPAEAGGGAALLFSPTEKVDGVTLAAWQGQYETWINEIPRPVNPGLHPFNGQNCATVNGMIFLAYQGSDCQVASNTPIGFGTANWECSTAEGFAESFEELTRKCEGLFFRDISRADFKQSVFIDGALVPGDRRWVTTTPGEVIDFPEVNLWGATPGPSNSVTRGFFFILRPMSVGEHVITLNGTNVGFGKFTVEWRFEVV